MSQELTGTILADKYAVEEVLREDNFGTIYRGTHLLMEKPVIIKVLSTALAVDDNIVNQFSGEARVNPQISHPNILNVTDFGTGADNLVYIVMEAVDGETLRSELAKNDKLRTDRAVRVARQTAAALSAAHSNNIVHGQLSPDNILLNHQLNGVETVKVTNFGAIAFTDEEYTNEQAKYLSPEQYADVSETDERSDIYTLGVIFYEMLTGEVPFSAETVTDLMLKKSEELPAPLSAFRNDVPADVEPVILKALSKNPAARQQSAAEFVVELDKAVRFDTEQDTVIVPAVAETANNNIWKTAFVVLAGISLLSAAIIYATQVRQTNPETQLQTDANGMPVQPLGPATGMSEQGVNNMLPYQLPEYGSDANMQYPDQVQQMPGGDGTDIWQRYGGSPPPGAPPQVYSGNQVFIPGDSGSIFMPNGDGTGVILVPKETNVNANVAPSTTKSPKGNNANAQPSPTPNEPADEVPPTPKPTVKPKASPPAEKPKENPPATTEKRPVSGKQQDSE